MSKRLGELATAYAKAKERADELWEVPDAEYDEAKSVEATREEFEAKEELLELVLRLHREGLL